MINRYTDLSLIYSFNRIEYLGDKLCFYYTVPAVNTLLCHIMKFRYSSCIINISMILLVQTLTKILFISSVFFLKVFLRIVLYMTPTTLTFTTALKPP